MVARPAQEARGDRSVRARSGPATARDGRTLPGRSLTAMSTTATIVPPAGTAPLLFDPYRDLSDEDLGERILAVKRRMGRSLLILGHHYQQDQVIRFADLRGDSYKLSQL